MNDSAPPVHGTPGHRPRGGGRTPRTDAPAHERPPAPAPAPAGAPGPGLPPGGRSRAARVRAAVRETVRRPRTLVARDALLWAVLVLPPAISAISPLEPSAARWWMQIAGIPILAVVIAISRSRPIAALILGISTTALHGNFVFAMPVLACLTGLRSRRSRPVLWGFAFVWVGGVALSVLRDIDATVWFPSTVWLVLLGVLPWLMGRYWRQYRELVRAGWERAERLEREQRIIAERERLRERARIARDMHDSLGHELALIAVRAGALQVADGLTERHRRAAAELRAGAAEATEHLREIIGVLREDAAAVAAGRSPAAGRRTRPRGPAPRASPSWSSGPARRASRSASPRGTGTVRTPAAPRRCSRPSRRWDRPRTGWCRRRSPTPPSMLRAPPSPCASPAPRPPAGGGRSR
ncbi:histidine kinase [Actinomadura sp. WMMB 499]|uniref:histidine kinase n=1 Tax=Actinomadura sp. WMMB 499 TaxID=1219491 RepID=UPI001243ED9F|nr:histidine kinase [Actinomadura sp. WMMB 499]QFG19815.1 hypothetical protein F7P10_00070 [Actinomadura sp. WMMB 499]